MSDRDELFLEHILEAIAAIERYISGGRDAFMADAMIQDAVLRRRAVIGEAVKNLSAELTARETAIPWRLIAGTRDRLNHGYFKVDLNAVWQTVERDLPPLREQVRRFLGQT
jgi:uncharacterized protein with HEPN domain